MLIPAAVISWAHLGLMFRKIASVVSCSVGTIWKCLIIFEQEACCFHFTLGPENYVVHCGCKVSLWIPDGCLGSSNALLFAPPRLGFPGGASDKEPTSSAGDLRDTGSIPGSGRYPSQGGHGTPLQCSCLENPMDRGVWRSVVHRVTNSHTRLKWLSTHMPVSELSSPALASVISMPFSPRALSPSLLLLICCNVI